jgi:putative oxidoreductase
MGTRPAAVQHPGSNIIDEPAGRQIGIALLWSLQIFTAVLFLLAAYPKLTGTPDMVELFNKIGVGQWLRYVTGGLECVGAILLLIPRLIGYGALLLVLVTVGALMAHYSVLGGSPVHAFEYLALAALVAWLRRKDFLL